MRLITIPTDYPNIVSVYIVVGTGSRNEIEPGKSGFAHLFEHLMFRGTPEYSPPEFEGGEVSDAWDWWSLGMIIAELAGGHHPFALGDGTMLNDRQIRASLAPEAAVTRR